LKIAALADATDPFAHPDTIRRFRIIENQAELEEALAYPWDKWTVFLHPAQREVILKDFAGPARVTGSAGTGKTVVALHRAVRLARDNSNKKILLATFSEPLANALQRNLKILAGDEPALLDRIVVASFRGIAEELHMLLTGHKAHLAARDIVQSLLKKAFEAEGADGVSEQFALSEWTNVIDAWQVTDAAGYLATPRMGRRARLGARQRESIWPVFQNLRKALTDRRLMTPASLFAVLTNHYAASERKPFDHIVIDEAQDLGVPELRFFSAIAASNQNSLFFAGDLGQRIFQLPFSWSGLGVDVRGRSSTLKVNYRTSHQIRTAADRLLPKSVRDADGLEDKRAGTISLFNGLPPQVTVNKTESDETAAVAAYIKACLSDGIEPQEIAVFVRSREQLSRARAALTKAEIAWTELVVRI
jgi:superfamily I DNA/RNA helicase